LTNPPTRKPTSVPSRSQLLRHWASAVILRKCCQLWELFKALAMNNSFDLSTILVVAGPECEELCLLRCLAFQPHGPSFILRWLMVFQEAIERLVVRDHLESWFHPSRWQWFGHSFSYANFRVSLIFLNPYFSLLNSTVFRSNLLLC
jgi:hypothetical protein